MYPSIDSSVENILGARMNISKGLTVPKTEDVVLRDGGKLVDATYLYADLANSSKIAQTLKKDAAAKIIKAYVNTATRILRFKDGAIRSFDGDRVMAIFMGADKDDRAVRAAMGIHWAVLNVIPSHIEKHFSDGSNFSRIDHGIGIASGESLIIRGGIRDNNDLISVGAAPNVAAKLSDIRGYSSSIHITDEVKSQLGEEYLSYDSSARTANPVWNRVSWGFDVGGSRIPVWGTNVHWEI